MVSVANRLASVVVGALVVDEEEEEDDEVEGSAVEAEDKSATCLTRSLARDFNSFNRTTLSSAFISSKPS